MLKKNYVLYVIGTYSLFYLLMMLTGLVMITTGYKNVSQIAMVVCSWGPTIVLLVLFKRLVPETSRSVFFRNLFRVPVNLKLIGVISLVQMFVFGVAVWCCSYQNGVSMRSAINLSLVAIGSGLFKSLITGATGEEAGWRGFLQPIFVKKHGIIKGSLIVGIIWGFWHAPLWFFTLGYSGADLLVYIIAFLIAIISMAVIMGICYDRNQNLVVPMWMHFLFNFTATLFVGNFFNFIIWLALFYAVTAIGFSLWYKRLANTGLSKV